jgi:hypothetical protein
LKLIIRLNKISSLPSPLLYLSKGAIFELPLVEIPKLIAPFIVAICSPLTIVDQVWRDIGESGGSCRTKNKEKDR